MTFYIKYCYKVFRMKKAYIMRGLPGTGKSTLAKELAGEHGAIHSTDEFFYKDTVYKHDRDNLSYYHHLNLWGFEESAMRGISPVICDNTNVRHVYYEKYVEVATKYGYHVEIITLPHLPLEVLAARNTHDVTLEALERMLAQWED